MPILKGGLMRGLRANSGKLTLLLLTTGALATIFIHLRIPVLLGALLTKYPPTKDR